MSPHPSCTPTQYIQIVVFLYCHFSLFNLFLCHTWLLAFEEQGVVGVVGGRGRKGEGTPGGGGWRGSEVTVKALIAFALEARLMERKQFPHLPGDLHGLPRVSRFPVVTVRRIWLPCRPLWAVVCEKLNFLWRKCWLDKQIGTGLIFSPWFGLGIQALCNGSRWEGRFGYFVRFIYYCSL